MFLVCNICSNLFKNQDGICGTPCGHVYHRRCLESVIERSNKCPQCDKLVSNDKMFNIYPSSIGSGSNICYVNDANLERACRTKVIAISGANDSSDSEVNDSIYVEANNIDVLEISGGVIVNNSGLRASSAKKASYYCTNAINLDARNMTIHVDSNNFNGLSTFNGAEKFKPDSEQPKYQENNIAASTNDGLNGLEQSQNIILELKNSLETTNKQNEVLVTNNLSLETKANTLESALKSSQSGLEQSQNIIFELKNSLETTNKQNEELVTNNLSLETKANTLERYLEMTKKQLETSQNIVNSFQQANQNELTSVKAELESSRNNTLHLEHNLKLWQVAVTELNNINQNLEKEKQETARKIESMAEEVTKLERIRDDLEESLDESNAKVTLLEKTNLKLTEKLQALESKTLKLKMQLEDANRDLPKLKESQNEANQRKRELESSNESLKNQVKELELSLASTREDLTARNYDVRVLRITVKSLSTQTTANKTLMVDTMTKYATSINSLRNELEFIRQKSTILKQNIDPLIKTNQELETTNHELTGYVMSVNSLSNDLNIIRQKSDVLKEHLNVFIDTKEQPETTNDG